MRTLTLQSGTPGWKLKAICHGSTVDQYKLVHPCGIESRFNDPKAARKFARKHSEKGTKQ